MCRISRSMLYLTFLSSEFIEIVLMTFVNIVFVIFAGIVFVTFVLSVAFIISSHTIFKSSRTIFKYLLFSQMHVLGLQQWYIFARAKIFALVLIVSLFNFWFDLHIALLNLHLQGHNYIWLMILLHLFFYRIKYFNTSVFCFTWNTYLYR